MMTIYVLRDVELEWSKMITSHEYLRTGSEETNIRRHEEARRTVPLYRVTRRGNLSEILIL